MLKWKKQSPRATTATAAATTTTTTTALSSSSSSSSSSAFEKKGAAKLKWEKQRNTPPIVSSSTRQQPPPPPPPPSSKASGYILMSKNKLCRVPQSTVTVSTAIPIPSSAISVRKSKLKWGKCPTIAKKQKFKTSKEKRRWVRASASSSSFSASSSSAAAAAASKKPRKLSKVALKWRRIAANLQNKRVWANNKDNDRVPSKGKLRNKMLRIDGVLYQRDLSGKKLVRCTSSSPPPLPLSATTRITTTVAKPSSTQKKSMISSSLVKRVWINGSMYKKNKDGSTLERVKNTSLKLRRTPSSASAAASKQDNQKHCTFFMLFGKCKHGEKCTRIHDPNRVAPCMAFLRGCCSNPSCSLQHTFSKEKMPVCTFFIQGKCFSDDCPFRHVNVNPNADVCKEFLSGRCSRGDACPYQHTFVCPSYSLTGKCAFDGKCGLKHVYRKRKRTEEQKSENIPSSEANEPKIEEREKRIMLMIKPKFARDDAI